MTQESARANCAVAVARVTSEHMSSTQEAEAVFSTNVEQTGSESVPSAPTTESPAEAAAAADEDAEGGAEANGAVNYDEAGLVEVELDQVLYRLDAGKQGTALCISTRKGDSWRWRFHGEARWDGRTLRSKSFDRRLLERLSKELQQAASGE